MQTLSVLPKDAPVRLDTYLRRFFHERSRSDIARAIKEGSILVNGRIAKPSYTVREYDSIECSFLHKEVEELLANTQLNIPILFENDSFLVINKPSGIQVHPSDAEKKKTVANWLIAQYPAMQNVGDDSLRPGIVHRLDKDTSGVMAIAKTQEAFENLKALFSDRAIQKKYLAIVHGTPESSEGEIDLPIARSRSFRKQTIVHDGTQHKGRTREALTRHATISTFSNKNQHYSLLNVFPKTGRMHQIRIHLSTIGHPIVGDTLYSRKDFPNPPEIQRFLLHAHTLSFFLFGQEHTFTAPIPEDMQTFLKVAKNKSN